MKKTWLIIIIVLVAIGGFLILARLLTGEDSWICDNGQWVKHGAPSSPMPSKPCGSQNTNTAQLNANTNTSQANANQNVNAANDCDQREKQIMALISAANYCQAASDCVAVAIYDCPFGCYLLYNKEANLTQIETEISEYHQVCPKCMADCMMPPETNDIRCMAGKCVDTRLDNIINQ